ncbi:MAG TPA: methyltransferase domain-containing protein [Thiolinea sp.]|nr:methyltransferase domain-containing protein [Thiolinea sp.]
MKLQETSSFIREWLKSPLVTASVVPSSRRLARKMVRGLHAGMGQVIELGPGTGVFTRELLAIGIPESALVLIELNGRFAADLKQKYPAATVVNGAAEAMSHLQLKRAGAVVSGLPFLSMKDRQIDAILEAAFQVLEQDGVFVQFTYGHRCPVRREILERHRLFSSRDSFVLNNFPPASVYHLKRKP